MPHASRLGRCAAGRCAAAILRGAAACIGLAAVATPTAARGACELELELLGADLKRVEITEAQAFQVAPHVDDALRYCRTGHERLGLRAIEKARAAARIPPRDELALPDQGRPGPVEPDAD
jgi:hypothetical protein